LVSALGLPGFGRSVFLLLSMGWSARMRDLAERITRFKPLQNIPLLGSVPRRHLSRRVSSHAYRDFVREHAYGLATQAFALARR